MDVEANLSKDIRKHRGLEVIYVPLTRAWQFLAEVALSLSLCFGVTSLFRTPSLASQRDGVQSCRHQIGLSNDRQKSWHSWKPGDKITLYQFYRLFGEKYGMRVLLDGGPIPIPRPYFAIDSDPNEFDFAIQKRNEMIQQMKNDMMREYLTSYGSDRIQEGLNYVNAYSYAPAQDLSSLLNVGRSESRYSLVEFIEGMESGLIDYPVVYKPNHSGLGSGVIFFEPSAVGQLNITVSKLVDTEDESDWIRFLKKEGFESVGGQDVYSLRVLRRHSRPTLERLLHKVATSHPIKYDRGMFERMVDPIKFSGALLHMKSI